MQSAKHIEKCEDASGNNDDSARPLERSQATFARSLAQAAFRLAAAAVKLATGDPEEACARHPRQHLPLKIRNARYLTYCDLCSQFPAVEGDAVTSNAMLP